MTDKAKYRSLNEKESVLASIEHSPLLASLNLFDMRYHSQDPEEAVAYSMAQTDGARFRLSEHFVLGEFQCKDGTDRVLVHPVLVQLLEAIRIHFNKPVIINSAYRTPSHNARIKGKPKSKHLLGMAADIVVKGVPPDKVADYAASLKVGGLGRYKSFTHVDVWGKNRRWDKR